LNESSVDRQIHPCTTAEQGLSAFLQAVATQLPNVDPQLAATTWITALESTGWTPALTPERFILQVTIKALATLTIPT